MPIICCLLTSINNQLSSINYRVRTGTFLRVANIHIFREITAFYSVEMLVKY